MKTAEDELKAAKLAADLKAKELAAAGALDAPFDALFEHTMLRSRVPEMAMVCAPRVIWADRVWKMAAPADRARETLPLSEGSSLFVEASPDGVLFSSDFRMDGGAAKRVSVRIDDVLGGFGDAPAPVRPESQAERDANKALLVALWNGLEAGDRVNFLKKVCSRDMLFRAARERQKR